MRYMAAVSLPVCESYLLRHGITIVDPEAEIVGIHLIHSKLPTFHLLLQQQHRSDSCSAVLEAISPTAAAPQETTFPDIMVVRQISGPFHPSSSKHVQLAEDHWRKAGRGAHTCWADHAAIVQVYQWSVCTG